MTTTTSHPSSETMRGVARWIIQMTAALLIFGAVLFLSAGKLDWFNGWAYMALYTFTQLLSGLVLISRNPEMLAERSKVREGTKNWDRILAPAIVIFCTLAQLITAGLDARFGWSSPIGPGLFWPALLVTFASHLFVLWAMASNPFFSGTVRIQHDRGQTVTRSGPYGIMRHPGYAGALIYNLVIPLVLGSWWTYLPSLLSIVLNILRTSLEDRTLQAELPGYQEYAARVRYRLIPGVW